MAEKKIIQLHQRSTTAALVSDLQTRELGFTSEDNYMVFEDNGGTPRYILTLPGVNQTGSGNIVLSDSPTLTGTIRIVGSGDGSISWVVEDPYPYTSLLLNTTGSNTAVSIKIDDFQTAIFNENYIGFSIDVYFNGSILLGAGSYITRTLNPEEGFTLNVDDYGIFTKGLIIGKGSTGVDYTLTFDGDTKDGVIRWVEGNDYFNFEDSIFMSGTKLIVFEGSSTDINTTILYVDLDDKFIIETHFTSIIMKPLGETALTMTHDGVEIGPSKDLIFKGALFDATLSLDSEYDFLVSVESGTIILKPNDTTTMTVQEGLITIEAPVALGTNSIGYDNSGGLSFDSGDVASFSEGIEIPLTKAITFPGANSTTITNLLGEITIIASRHVSCVGGGTLFVDFGNFIEFNIDNDKKVGIEADRIILRENVWVSDTTPSTSVITGSGRFDGGVGIAEKLYVGEDLNAAADINATGRVTKAGTYGQLECDGSGGAQEIADGSTYVIFTNWTADGPISNTTSMSTQTIRTDHAGFYKVNFWFKAETEASVTLTGSILLNGVARSIPWADTIVSDTEFSRSVSTIIDCAVNNQISVGFFHDLIAAMDLTIHEAVLNVEYIGET